MFSLFCISNAVATLITSINDDCILIVNSTKFICCFVARHYSRKTIRKLLAGCGKKPAICALLLVQCAFFKQLSRCSSCRVETKIQREKTMLFFRRKIQNFQAFCQHRNVLKQYETLKIFQREVSQQLNFVKF